MPLQNSKFELMTLAGIMLFQCGHSISTLHLLELFCSSHACHAHCCDWCPAERETDRVFCRYLTGIAGSLASMIVAGAKKSTAAVLLLQPTRVQARTA